MKLLILDDGHGVDTHGKRTPTGIKENQFNSAVVEIAKSLAEAQGLKVYLTAPDNDDPSLKTRTDRANRACSEFGKNCESVLVSVHYNAHLTTFEGSDAQGIETFYNKNSPEGMLLAHSVHSELITGTRQVDRGIKTNDLHITREAKMPAVLIEAGFMDDPREADLMLNKDFQTEVATEIVRGVCKYFGIPYKEKVEVKPALWKLDGLKYLHSEGFLSDYEGWAAKIDEPIPSWAVFTILANIDKKRRR